jgi:hypothetical protein
MEAAIKSTAKVTTMRRLSDRTVFVEVLRIQFNRRYDMEVELEERNIRVAAMFFLPRLWSHWPAVGEKRAPTSHYYQSIGCSSPSLRIAGIRPTRELKSIVTHN